MSGYRNGCDLIMGLVINNVFKPLGYSTGCKISDSTETGERVTKESESAYWKEKYIKSLAESITADGFVYDYGTGTETGVSFPNLKDLWINRTKVKVRYKYRSQTGANEGLYEGDFIITSLEQDGPADDDEKWSVTFENSGAVVAVSNGGGGGGG